MRHRRPQLQLVLWTLIGCGEAAAPKESPLATDCEQRFGDDVSPRAQAVEAECRADPNGSRCEASQFLTEDAARCMASRQFDEVVPWIGGLYHDKLVHAPVWRMFTDLEVSWRTAIPHRHVMLDGHSGQPLRLSPIDLAETTVSATVDGTPVPPFDEISGTVVLEADSVRAFTVRAGHHRQGAIVLMTRSIELDRTGRHHMRGTIDVRGDVRPLDAPVDITIGVDAVRIRADVELADGVFSMALVMARAPSAD